MSQFRPPRAGKIPEAVSGISSILFSIFVIFMPLFSRVCKMICYAVCLLRFGGSTFSRTDESGMKYLITLLYKKCWDVMEVRQYIRRFLFDVDDAEYEPKKLLEILDALAAMCLGESEDLPPPP
jgi:hypothetical protein